MHCVFHVFVILGSICHILAILLFARKAFPLLLPERGDFFCTWAEQMIWKTGKAMTLVLSGWHKNKG